MANTLEWAGSARGRITEFSAQEAKSGAVGINLTIAVESYFDKEAGEWVDCRDSEFESTGTLWVVKKSGEINGTAALSLIEHAGWRDIESTADGTWKPTPCGFNIEEEPATEKYPKKWRIGFINGYNTTPGGGNITPEKAKALGSQYGGAFRALRGTIQRAATVPAGKPAAPKPTTPSTGPKPTPKPKGGPLEKQPDGTLNGVGTGNTPAEEEDDSIPFSFLIPLLTGLVLSGLFC
jgi:hypothetical protein